MREAQPAPSPAQPRPPLSAERDQASSPPAPAEPGEGVRPPPQHRHEGPEEDDVVEPDRPPAEADQRLELGDRLGQRREAEQHREAQEHETPQTGPRTQDDDEDDRDPLHPRRDRPDQARENRPAEDGSP